LLEVRSQGQIVETEADTDLVQTTRRHLVARR
jgi:hypothetical protein